MQFILTCSQMPTAQPPKLPYCGADAATEELLPEPSPGCDAPGRARAGKQRLRDDLRHLQSALASAVGLLMPYIAGQQLRIEAQSKTMKTAFNIIGASQHQLHGDGNIVVVNSTAYLHNGSYRLSHPFQKLLAVLFGPAA